jgi:hypothetical protein
MRTRSTRFRLCIGESPPVIVRSPDGNRELAGMEKA